MPSIQIKDVPPDTHATLRRRAASAHQSLQEYLLQHLIEEAAHPTVDELFERVSHRSGGTTTLKTATRAIRAERDRR
jgi:antitoxin FitA